MRLICLSFLFFAVGVLYAQSPSIASQLGYPDNARLLIIHADDLGVAHSENKASIIGLENSPVNSASIMVPCPWFPEIAAYARNNKQADLGLHLTLNSEWKYYKWGPVSSRDAVASLLNKQGYFYATVDSTVQKAKPGEVELELRNQVKKAYEAGIDVTHLDAHMRAALSTPEFIAAYMRVGKEFGLPLLLPRSILEYNHPEINALLDKKTVLMDGIHTVVPEDYRKGPEKYYNNLLKNLPPGLHSLQIHLAYDDAEMQAITVDHPEWGASWRQADFDYFTSDAFRQLLEAEDIILVTYREIRDKISRAE